MPTYYKPGTRKNNRTWTVRGSIDGRKYEISTDVANPRNKRAAADAWDVFKAAVRARGVAEPRAPETFADVADLYADGRNLSKADRRFLAKLKTKLGRLPIGEISQIELDQAARDLYPGAAPGTINRQVYAPAAAVLHYAAPKLRPYMVVRKLREAEPETRRPAPGVRDLLLANTEGHQHAFLIWLFFQGWRITETLEVDARNIDLQDATVRAFVRKAKRWKALPLHPETVAALATIGLPAAGRIWPWHTRDGVYKWLNKLTARLGVIFTPHMARHEFGGGLRELGAVPRDLVDVGTWTNERSVQRYTTAGSDHARDVIGRLARKQEK